MQNCLICKELISENAPTFTIIYGFGGDIEMHSAVLHVDCAGQDNPCERVIEEFEVTDEDF